MAASLELLVDDGGMRIWHINRAETEFLYEEIFAHRSYARCGITVPPSAVVVDVGANIGLFSLWIQREAAHPRIIAIEPSPQCFAALQLNLTGPATSLHRVAIGDARQASAEFLFYPSAPGESTRHTQERQDMHALTAHEAIIAGLRAPQDDGASPVPFTANMHPLSDIIAVEELSRIDLLKVRCIELLT